LRTRREESNFLRFCADVFYGSSDVARVPCALGQNIFVPPPIKTAEFEVKNRCKSAEEAKAEHLLFETAVF